MMAMRLYSKIEGSNVEKLFREAKPTPPGAANITVSGNARPGEPRASGLLRSRSTLLLQYCAL